MGVKMVMSGEGADEALGGYLYFHKAPNGTELHEECVRKIGDLYKYDCLRANKATMAHGLEARVPFLDKDVLDELMSLDGEFKMIKKGMPEQVRALPSPWRRTRVASAAGGGCSLLAAAAVADGLRLAWFRLWTVCGEVGDARGL